MGKLFGEAFYGCRLRFSLVCQSQDQIGPTCVPADEFRQLVEFYLASAVRACDLLEGFEIQRFGVAGQLGLVDLKLANNLVQQPAGDAALVMFDQVQIGSRNAETFGQVALLDPLPAARFLELRSQNPLHQCHLSHETRAAAATPNLKIFYTIGIIYQSLIYKN